LPFPMVKPGMHLKLRQHEAVKLASLDISRLRDKTKEGITLRTPQPAVVFAARGA